MEGKSRCSPAPAFAMRRVEGMSRVKPRLLVVLIFLNEVKVALCFLWTYVVFLEIRINCNSLTETHQACSRVFPSLGTGPRYNYRL